MISKINTYNSISYFYLLLLTMLPDLNRLKVFYHIYNEQSSTAAARVLHITQSGVSQHLKKLEDELQVSLFTRVNRRLVPTTEGHELYNIVRTFMISLENGVQQFGKSRNTPSGLLRIGAPSEFGTTYFPRILASFNHRYQGVTFQLEMGDPQSLFDMVSCGELDFAYIDILPIFLDTSDRMSTYTIEPLIDEEFILACSSEYSAQKIHTGGYDELLKLNYISYKSDIALFRSWFNLQFGREPASLNLVLVADSARAIISALEEGMGAGIIVSHLVGEQLQSGSIVALGKVTKKLKNTIACVNLKNKERTLTERYFQDHFRNELRTFAGFMDKS